MIKFLESLVDGRSQEAKEYNEEATIWWMRDDYSDGNMIAPTAWKALFAAENLIRGEQGGIVVAVLSFWNRPILIGAHHDEGQYVICRKPQGENAEWLAQSSAGGPVKISGLQQAVELVANLMRSGNSPLKGK